MNGNDVVEHIEGCSYCWGLEDGEGLTKEQMEEEQIKHATEN
jgi:hypothetical protein